MSKILQRSGDDSGVTYMTFYQASLLMIKKLGQLEALNTLVMINLCPLICILTVLGVLPIVLYYFCGSAPRKIV